MINQVGNNLKKYSFVPFKGDGANFGVSTPNPQPQNDEYKKRESDVKKEKEQKTRRFGHSILIVGLLAGLGLLAGGKFFSKAGGTWAERWWKKITRTKDETSTLWGGLKQLLKKSQVIFNVATLKDILFVKSLKKLPGLKQFNQWVTKCFEKASIATSTKSYRKTASSFDEMYGKFEEASSKIQDKQTQVEIARRIQSVRDKYYRGFGDAARKERLAQVQAGLQDLDEKVWKETYRNPLGFWEHVKKGEFVAEEKAKDAKVRLLGAVMKEKFEISNSPLDCYHATKKYWDKLGHRIHENDAEAVEIMKRLSGHLNKYKKSINSLGVTTATFPKGDVLSDLQALRAHLKKPNDYYTEDSVKLITEAIDNLRESMSATQKGEIQKIMDIYEKHLTPDEFAKLQKSVNKTLIRLNKSADMEHDKLFDKIRDLKLGSAPHDVLAFVGSLGVIGWGVSKADSKDEKISVTLKYAIPALFGVAMAIGCTVGLIASGPSLLIGLASTIPINMIGKAVDNARKKKDDSSQASLLPTFKLESPMQMIREIENNAKKLV